MEKEAVAQVIVLVVIKVVIKINKIKQRRSRKFENAFCHKRECLFMKVICQPT